MYIIKQLSEVLVFCRLSPRHLGSDNYNAIHIEIMGLIKKTRKPVWQLENKKQCFLEMNYICFQLFSLVL